MFSGRIQCKVQLYAALWLCRRKLSDQDNSNPEPAARPMFWLNNIQKIPKSQLITFRRGPAAAVTFSFLVARIFTIDIITFFI